MERSGRVWFVNNAVLMKGFGQVEVETDQNWSFLSDCSRSTSLLTKNKHFCQNAKEEAHTLEAKSAKKFLRGNEVEF
ncbi:hypothetical protein Tco_0364890 [Tanacetum coccineum]